MGYVRAATAAFVAIACMGGAAQAMPSASYLMKAGAGDKYEIESSKLVMSSTNAKLKSFATMMVTDHMKSTAMVKAAATRAHLTPKPPVLTAEQSANLSALKAATGAARDALYITQQKAAHQEALTLHQDEATTGTSAPLKQAAAKIVPVVKHHIQQLAAM